MTADNAHFTKSPAVMAHSSHLIIDDLRSLFPSDTWGISETGT
jgi:hypothetical protein